MYRSGQYFEALKPVRNRIRRFPSPSIVLATLERLHHQEPGDIEALRREPPWLLLILIKWALLFGEDRPSIRRDFTARELNVLINKIQEVERGLRLPSQHEDLMLFMRGIANQQFWHQEPLSRTRLSRQHDLFGRFELSSRFNRWFQEGTGVTIATWLHLAFLLLASLLPRNVHYVSESSFGSFLQGVSPDTLTAFLGSLSKTPGELRDFLHSLERPGERDGSEFRERTPLTRFPLLKLGNRHYYYSMRVLQESLQTFVYDTLRRRDAGQFMTIFGPKFEQYVRRGVEYTGHPFRDEAELRLLSGGGKVVDFMIEANGGRIFVDAKGVEMSHKGMTSHRPEIVAGEAKASLLKAISQGSETARRIAQCQQESWQRRQNFLLVVTFKDLYFGTGTDLAKCVPPERLRAALGRPLDEATIPLEHMYFVSIEEFDYLAALVRSRSTSLAALLADFASLDREMETKRFKMSQHLARFGHIDAPTFAQEAFEQLSARALSLLRSNSATHGVGT